MPLSKFRTLLLVVLGALMLSGCMERIGRFAADWADKETYPIIAAKQEEVLGEAAPFSIEPAADPLTEHVIEQAGIAGDEFTTAGLTLSLNDALTLALHNNRQYQARKEQLYLAALRLTGERHVFAPLFSGLITGQRTRQPTVETNVEVIGTETVPLPGFPDVSGIPGFEDFEPPTTTIVNTRTETEIGAERFGQLDTSVGVRKLFATGALVTLQLSQQFMRFYSNSPREQASGLFSASVVQPLLRSAGPDVTLENLRQAERDVLYEVRDFARFERQFVVERIDEYFRLLQLLDAIRNQQASLETLHYGREQAEELAEAGRLDIFQVNQAQTQELNAQDALYSVQVAFMQGLEQFRSNLGLPPETAVVPDPAELERLSRQELEPLDIELAAAVEMALARRLDYHNAADQIEDAERFVRVTENALLPVFDLVADFSVTDEEENQPLDLGWKRRRYSYGFNLELPLDRKAERNNYRSALIFLQSARRAEVELHDLIVREVRSLYWELMAARNSYEIQLRSLEIARMRVESTSLLLQAGRVQVRDVLDADAALLDARNRLTEARINYFVTRLRFLVAIEALEVDMRGLWLEAARSALAAPTPEPLPVESSSAPVALPPP
ncbi:MAG TPA: TolC family protein [Candidatus Sumerlaeota bacterium]|nr:TolC family protein [Candidatus Sumerlaeota bacterium]